jgi:hypothetical protein
MNNYIKVGKATKNSYSIRIGHVFGSLWTGKHCSQIKYRRRLSKSSRLRSSSNAIVVEVFFMLSITLIGVLEQNENETAIYHEGANDVKLQRHVAKTC